jgi:hypothetical protein
MAHDDDRSLPAALRAMAQMEFDYADGDGVDFELIKLAEQSAAGAPQTAAAVIEQASREFPDFERTIAALCR